MQSSKNIKNQLEEVDVPGWLKYYFEDMINVEKLFGDALQKPEKQDDNLL